ncbi:MAG: hypothetical protein H6708_16645 [Kofleriaceae bacterium]|nr:hypothetical protein [Myxococcales bacterium]MCB9562034.1 hypothetical protein [Kofleriaceae bacterium]
MLVAAVLTLFASSCGSPSPTPTASTNKCTHPIRGQRYGVCGRVSTSSVQRPGASHALSGSVDSTGTPGTGTTYRIEGGTFHAAR